MTTARPLTVSLPFGLFSAAAFTMTQPTDPEPEPEPQPQETSEPVEDDVQADFTGLPGMEVWNDDADSIEGAD